MIARLLLIAAVAGLLLAEPGHAQAPAAPATKPVKVLQYLTPADIDPARLLPPPPAEGSAAAKAELTELHRIIAARTPERLAQARWDDDHEDASAFFATVAPGFDLKALPATAEVLHVVETDGSLAASRAKSLFARKRPWVIDSSIPTCDPGDKPLTSYPSGHATYGYSLAMTYAVLMPDKAQAFMARASDYAFSRQVCGSHYASDTQASQALSAAVVTALLKNVEFAAKIEAARAELKAAGYAR
jgi:acid phosphatase (class A)